MGYPLNINITALNFVTWGFLGSLSRLEVSVLNIDHSKGLKERDEGENLKKLKF